ncbi:MAG TPA: hypothetical protein VJB12_03895 [Candidatus Nanoarchaeia archaeon]|nr:hypothetical protein [Candidatus Nanoarchaeia archaeon]
MIEEVRKDILDVLRNLLSILETKEEKDALEIRELANHVIHDATLFEDEDAISVTVLIYAYSKILQHLGSALDSEGFVSLLSKAIREVEVNDLQGFRGLMRRMFAVISSNDSQLNMYVNDVLGHARIKQGSAVCQHGISMAKSAQMLNISQWDLMQYLGRTMHSEQMQNGHDIKNRLKFARGLFS